jgi:uncharacterized RDD family membrane protein YckC
MPRVTPPPPPQRRVIEPAVVAPSEPVRVSPAASAGPVSGTHIPPPAATTAARAQPRYAFGNPLVYVLARFFAFAFDVALIGGFATVLMYSLIAVNPITGLPTNSQRGFDATLALGIAIALVYAWVSEALFGTTIWKLAFGLHVYSTHDRRVGLGSALVRSLLRPIDVLIVGGILALLPGHRRLGDLAAGTIVARSPLRAFAPLLGWILVLVVCGIPFVTIGFGATMRSLIAFYEFVPGLAARIVLDAQTLIGHLLPHAG